METTATDGGRRGRGPLRRVASVAWRLSLLALFVIAGFAIGGFVNFTRIVTSAVPPANTGAAEAVVVLTGGPMRIGEALRMLQGNETRRLLITGVNEATSARALQRTSGGSARLYECCVDLGYEARDTPGNARETAEWARRHGFASLAVVSSDYHMPRAMLEMRRAMPDVAFIEVPVPTPALRRDDWYTRPEAVRRLLGEWAKYLSAQSRGILGSEPLRLILPS